MISLNPAVISGIDLNCTAMKKFMLFLVLAIPIVMNARNYGHKNTGNVRKDRPSCGISLGYHF